MPFNISNTHPRLYHKWYEVTWGSVNVVTDLGRLNEIWYALDRVDAEE
jgi:hypothetical protein